MGDNTFASNRGIHYFTPAAGMSTTRIADWPYDEISGHRPAKSEMVYATGAIFLADAPGILERHDDDALRKPFPSEIWRQIHIRIRQESEIQLNRHHLVRIA